MPTIGRRWPTSAPKGDYAALCDSCGVRYRRSQLRRNYDGKLNCLETCFSKTASQLDAENAAADVQMPKRPHDGGDFDKGLT